MQRTAGIAAAAVAAGLGLTGPGLSSDPGSSAAKAAEIVSVLPLNDRILMVHFDEGYVVHHVAGRSRTDERVVISPLDVARASARETWSLASTDDTAFAGGRAPVAVHRKSKGTNFAWFVDRWVDNRAVNDRPDHTKEHWIYLSLPEPMQAGRTYTLSTGGLNTGGENLFTFRFDIENLRSEAVKVNTLGYVPTAPKFGYIFHWKGDGGPADFSATEGREFFLLNVATGQRVYSGRVRLRARANNPETYHVSDSPPYGNFLGTDVLEADFSAFTTPGTYRLVVEGVGSSFDFRIDPDVLRPAHRAVMRALFHNRSGIALTRPYTEFERPAPHNPRLTPGFAGRLRYTTVRSTEWGSDGGDAAALSANFRGPLEDVWGWYQDAGDWDSYDSHFRVPTELLFTFELGPRRFRDGENNIPESGNGLPDILDEAAWLPRFCHRLRHELLRKGWGTGGVGLRIAGDAFGSDEGTNPDGSKYGRGSWQDTDRYWAVSGEDPWSTFRYAGAAAHLAYALRLAGVTDPEGVDWEREAREAFAWALANTRPGDEELGGWGNQLWSHRAYAAAALFRLTGDRDFERQLAADVARHYRPNTAVWDNDRYPVMVYLLGAPNLRRDPQLEAKLRGILLASADANLETANRRALRWAGNFSMPMLIGQQTTPWALELAAAEAVVRQTHPDRARAFRNALHTTADHFLGGNSLNMVWITGVGPRYPAEIFHMDAWYNGKGRFHEGMIPYSPWRKERELGQGPWDVAWPHQTLHPPIDAWPGSERWFSNRCAPLGSEFTVHQNLGPAAAFYGLLLAEHP